MTHSQTIGWKTIAVLLAGASVALWTLAVTCARPHMWYLMPVWLIVATMLTILGPLTYNGSLREKLGSAGLVVLAMVMCGAAYASVPPGAKAIVFAQGTYVPDRVFFNPITESLFIVDDTLQVVIPLRNGDVLQCTLVVEADMATLATELGGNAKALQDSASAWIIQSVSAYAAYADTTTQDYVAAATRHMPPDIQLTHALMHFPLPNLSLDLNTKRVIRAV